MNSGLLSQIKRVGAAAGPTDAKLQAVDVALIDFDSSQPRKNIDQERLKALAATINEVGLINPITIRPNGTRYILETGERRFRAVKEILKLPQITAVVKDTRPEDLRVRQLIENMQKDDLTPFEIADCVAQLVNETGKSHGANADVARRLGITDRSWVTKQVTIAAGSDRFREYAIAANIRDLGMLYRLARMADDELESEIANAGKQSTSNEPHVSAAAAAVPTTRNARTPAMTPAHKQELSTRAAGAAERLGLTVKAVYNGNGKARLEFDCDYDRLLEILDRLDSVRKDS